jgi:hypothetical protein
MKPMKGLCERQAELLNIEADGIDSYHYSIKG